MAGLPNSDCMISRLAFTAASQVGYMKLKRCAVFRHVAEDLHGDLDQNAEGALRALHDVVDLGAGGGGRVIQGLEGPGRGDVFLAEDDVVGVAVIGRGLAGAQCHDPASHRGILEGLREVAAGIAELSFKELRGLIQGFLVGRSEHARLDACRLVELIYLQELVHVRAHHQGDAALGRAAPEVYGRAGAEDRYRDTLGIAVFHDLLHIVLIARMHYHVGHLADDTLPQFQHFLGGLAVGEFDAAVIVEGHIFRSHNGRECLDLSGLKRRRAVQDYRGITLILLLRNRHRSCGNHLSSS